VLCAFIVSTITLRGLNLYHANTYSQSCILWELSSTTLLGMSAEMSLCRSCSVCVFGNNAYRAVNSRVCACIACNSTPDSYRRQPLQLMSAHCPLERLIVIRTAGACSACRDRSEQQKSSTLMSRAGTLDLCIFHASFVLKGRSQTGPGRCGDPGSTSGIHVRAACQNPSPVPVPSNCFIYLLYCTDLPDLLIQMPHSNVNLTSCIMKICCGDRDRALLRYPAVSLTSTLEAHKADGCRTPCRPALA